MATQATRERAGKIITQLMYYRGVTADTLGNASGAISTPTIRRLQRGIEVSDSRLAVMDGLLSFPPGTIALLVEGNADAIAALPWRDEDRYVRDYMLAGLQVNSPARKRAAR